MIIDPNDFSRRDAYFFGISLICPRPIAFITSMSEEGVVNAAPFSYFNGISTRPMLLSVSIAHKGKEARKDTLNNILARKEFCVNMVTEEMAQGVTISAADFPPEESEMDYNGFTLKESTRIKVPGIQESPAVMECRLERVIDDMGPFSLVIGEVLCFQLADEFVDSETKYFKAAEAKLLGRLGGSDFCKIGEVITVPRKTPEEIKASRK